MLGSSGALNVTAAVDKGSLSGNMNLTFDPSQGTIRSGTSVSATLEGLGPALWGIDQALAPGQQVQMWVATERRGTAQQIVAQGGFIVNSGGVPEAEFALVVADSHQRRGFGARLLQAMRQGACAHVLCVLRATVRSDNRGMRSLLGLREQRRSASARQGSAQESPQQSPQISRHGECQALPAAQQARGTAFEAVLDTAPGWRFRHRLPMFAALCQARQDELPTQPAQRHLREVTPRMQVA